MQSTVSELELQNEVELISNKYFSYNDFGWVFGWGGSTLTTIKIRFSVQRQSAGKS